MENVLLASITVLFWIINIDCKSEQRIENQFFNIVWAAFLRINKVLTESLTRTVDFIWFYMKSIKMKSLKTVHFQAFREILKFPSGPTWVGSSFVGIDQRSSTTANRKLAFAGARPLFHFRKGLKPAWPFPEMKNPHRKVRIFCLMWSHLGSNQGPLDYESSALTS